MPLTHTKAIIVDQPRQMISNSTTGSLHTICTSCSAKDKKATEEEENAAVSVGAAPPWQCDQAGSALAAAGTSRRFPSADLRLHLFFRAAYRRSVASARDENSKPSLRIHALSFDRAQLSITVVSEEACSQRLAFTITTGKTSVLY